MPVVLCSRLLSEPEDLVAYPGRYCFHRGRLHGNVLQRGFPVYSRPEGLECAHTWPLPPPTRPSLRFWRYQCDHRHLRIGLAHSMHMGPQHENEP